MAKFWNSSMSYMWFIYQYNLKRIFLYERDKISIVSVSEIVTKTYSNLKQKYSIINLIFLAINMWLMFDIKIYFSHIWLIGTLWSKSMSYMRLVSQYNSKRICLYKRNTISIVYISKLLISWFLIQKQKIFFFIGIVFSWKSKNGTREAVYKCHVWGQGRC